MPWQPLNFQIAFRQLGIPPPPFLERSPPMASLNKIGIERLSRQGDDGIIQNVYASVFQSGEQKLSVMEFNPKSAATGIGNSECANLRMHKDAIALSLRTIFTKSRPVLRKIHVRRLIKILFTLKIVKPDDVATDPAADFEVIRPDHRLPRIVLNVSNRNRRNRGNPFAGNQNVILALDGGWFIDL